MLMTILCDHCLSGKDSCLSTNTTFYNLGKAPVGRPYIVTNLNLPRLLLAVYKVGQPY
jgi:hypothetical protein